MFKKKHIREECWKKLIGCNLKEEYLIYQYLCDDIKKKSIKNIPEDKRFTRYSKWKEYVFCKYHDCKELLPEFIKYLNHKKRRSKLFKNITYAIFIPIVIPLAIKIFDIGIDAVSVMKFPNIFSFPGMLNKILLVFGTLLAIIVVAIFLILFVLLPVFWIVYDCITLVLGDQKKFEFYKDYIKILKKLKESK